MGWAAWTVLLVGVSIALVLVPTRWGVTYVYRDALKHSLAGQPLYGRNGHGFLYLPASVALYGPLLLEPRLLGEIAWRCFVIGLFAWGNWRFAQTARGWLGRPVFGPISIVGAIVGMTAARDGQATLPMAALIMSAIADLAARRDARAGLAAAGSLLCKPLSIPIMILLAAVRPRSIPAMATATAAMIAAPFLLADRGWLVRQYEDFSHVLTMTDKLSDQAWATLSGAATAFGMPIPGPLRLGMSLGTALVTFCGCLVALRRFSPCRAATTIYSLGMLWLMLFSPRTEHNTYACIAPTLALGIVTGWYGIGPDGKGRSMWRMMLYWLAVGLLLGTYELGRAIAPRITPTWIAPLVSLPVLLDVWREVFLTPSATAHETRPS